MCSEKNMTNLIKTCVRTRLFFNNYFSFYSWKNIQPYENALGSIKEASTCDYLFFFHQKDEGRYTCSSGRFTAAVEVIVNSKLIIWLKG
jgi:hypothetical protein